MEKIAIHSCKTGLLVVREMSSQEKTEIEDMRIRNQIRPSPAKPSLEALIAVLKSQGLITGDELIQAQETLQRG